MDPMYWSVILLALGVAVIFLELFVPSGGLLGVLAAILIISGIIVAFMSSFHAGVSMLMVTAISLPLLIILLLKIWPQTPVGKRVLIGSIRPEDVLPSGDIYDELPKLKGKTGRAKSKMLPSGIVEINGKSYDAVSDGFAIEKGDSIIVTEVRMHKLFVRKYEPDESVALQPKPNDDSLLSKSLDELGIDPIEN
ncbi:MAG TPA: NfeD family protein [Pirellulaceae bacterium]|nr:NfeD family protein [Pirellulaceae bacterium]HMO91267.1 NfeD family protein [Pirellulaceae bacterium]HMP68549.1 NfeD family protein [Pirellulaceae bacterium]